MANLGLTDKPVGSINEESLGVSDYVLALSEFIESCETPMTISIQADWGAGKTSMMNLVKEKLSSSNKNISTMWFNTWQFSQFDMGDDLPISLLSQFVKRLGGEDSDEVVKKLAKLTKKAGGMLARVALGNVAGNALEGGAKVVDSMFGEEQLDASEQIVKLKAQLESIVANKIQKQGHDRIVVFIDDLDRLVPQKAVELLEIMKLFLDIPKCVFVLAVDYNVVITGLEKKFGSGVDDLKGKSFFDKIIQLPFNLPVANYDVNKYFKDLLGGNFEYDDDDIDMFVRLANSSVGFNPRSMKRLFNSLQLLKMVAKSKNILGSDDVASGEEKQRILFGILCLQTTYESMYRFMLKHQSNINQEFFAALKDMQSLKDSEYFDEICKALKIKDEKDEKLIRFLSFLNNLFDAIQLKSDTSEDADENLSEKEIENFLRFLSFSSITTSNSSGINSTSGTFTFKSYINDFIKDEVMLRFKDDLAFIGVERIETYADNNNFGCVYFNVKRFGLDFDFVISTNSYENVSVRLDDTIKDICFKRFAKKWFEDNFKADYPKMSYNGRATYGFIELKNEKIDKNTPMDLKIDLYKKAIINELELFLPKIKAYFEATEVLKNKYKTFINNLISNVKHTFEDGWKFDLEEAYNLGRVRIYLAHEQWGENPLWLSINTDLDYSSDCYFISLERNKWNKSYNGENELYENLAQDFGDDKSSQNNLFYRYVDERFEKLFKGNIYDLNPKDFIDENLQKEFIAYLCENLTKFKKYKDEIKKLSLQE